MKMHFYMLSLCLYGTSLMAQGPGGVGGASLKLWIKADAITDVTGTLVNAWTYQNDVGKSFIANGATRPTLTANAVNFKPGVTFSGAQLMDGPILGNAPLAGNDDDYSVFGVWMTNTTTPGTPQRIWSQRAQNTSNADGTGLWLYNGNWGNQAEIGGAGGFVHLTLGRTYAPGWNITQYNLLNQATNDFVRYDDRNLATGGSTPINTDPDAPVDGATMRSLLQDHNRLGARLAVNEEPFIGTLVELIVFDRPITDATERLRIFSYLSLKYGIPLAGSNMVNSAGTTIWNNALLAGFNNAVFGIGQDDNANLLTNTSNSVDTAGQINLIVSNPTDLQNGEYLLIGHNGGSSNEGTEEVPASATSSQRIDRKWLVQHTGDVGAVKLTFDLTNSTFTGSPALLRDFRLVIDTDGDGDLSTGTAQYRFPASFIGNELSFNNVVLPQGAVIGLISNASAALPVTWTSFDGKFENGKVNLAWTVSNNENGDRYDVEHSTDGITYKVIGVVDNNPEVKSYSFSTDNYANGANHYRIHQIDVDGQDIYSKIYTVSINSGTDFTFKVVNNPVRNNSLKLQLRSAQPVKAMIEIWSLTGVQVMNRQQNIDAGPSTVTVPLSTVPAGSYVLKIRQNGVVRTAGIIKL